MATIASRTFRRGRRNLGQTQITSVEVTLSLTLAEAKLLPPSTHIRPHFPKVAWVQSYVSSTGGELVLRYYMSERPFNGAEAEDIPSLVRNAVNRWLASRRRGGGSGGN